MPLRELLSQKKSSILNRWFDLLGGTRPSGLGSPSNSKDEFSNPEGTTVSREINALFDELLQDRMNSEKTCASLGNILRIKAVQDLSPGTAVGFIFYLKEAIVEELADEIEKHDLFRQWLEYESRVDRLASLAFEIYTQCREKVYQLRVNEVKADRDMAFRILDRVETAGRKRAEALE